MMPHPIQDAVLRVDRLSVVYVDTIRVDGNVAAAISLAPGTWSELGLPLTYSDRTATLGIDKARPDLTDARTVFIYDTVVIENATGGGGNDRLTGSAGNNRLEGGGGDDTIDGAAGVDTAAYASARAATMWRWQRILRLLLWASSNSLS